MSRATLYKNSIGQGGVYGHRLLRCIVRIISPSTDCLRVLCTNVGYAHARVKTYDCIHVLQALAHVYALMVIGQDSILQLGTIDDTGAAQ